MAKVESDLLPPGPAPDLPDVEVNFSIKIGEEWRDLGNAVSDRFAFARLPFPQDLFLDPGHYEILVRTLDGSRPARGHLLITGNKPALLVSVDGAVLRSREGVLAFLGRNLLHRQYELVPGAHEALHQLAEHYQIVYVAPLRDESLLETTRENLFERDKLPPGPILTNDFGLRLKEQSKALSHQRLREFMDNVIAELRGFYGVPLVGGIGRADSEQIDREIMDRHCLETRVIPKMPSRWWPPWRWFREGRNRLLLVGETAWHDIAKHFSEAHPRLERIAHGLYERRFHPDPHTRFQTKVDLVSGAALCFGNSAKLHIDGMEAFGAVTNLFQGAETVFAEIYEFGHDIIGKTFANIFSERAAAGKHVRLTSDFLGSSGWWPPSMLFFARMAAKGVRVSRFVFPLAELPALLDAPFFRTHRKVAALKIKGENGRVRDVAVLGGRNWKDPYWFTLHDYTIVVEGTVVKNVVHHLAKVANELTGSPLTKRERQAFEAASPDAHADNQPLRYVVHYPKDDQNIQRVFLALLQNSESDTFMMESPFPLTTELMREIIAEKKARPDKEITWVLGTHGDRAYGLLDAYAHAQGLLLKRHGIRVLIRGPLNENKMSPMHAKTFSDGQNLAVCSWNPDQQSDKDLETAVLVTPNPEDPRSTERIEDMLNRGIRKDIAEGIDLEEWLQVILKNQTGTPEDLYRTLLLKLAKKTQASVNYFL